MVCRWILCFLLCPLFPFSSPHSDSWMPLVNLTHHLLRDTNSSLWSNCWVCLSTQTHQSLAIPAPLITWTDSPMKLYITYSTPSLHGPFPISDLNRRLSFFEPLTASYSFRNPERRAIALLQLLHLRGLFPLITRLTSVIYPDQDYLESFPHPIWGPLSTQTVLTSQAPLCIARFFKVPAYATFVGNLSTSLCNHTLHLSPSDDHQTLDPFETYTFMGLTKIQGTKWKNPLRFSGPPSLTSLGQSSYPCKADGTYCHTSSATPWRQCPSFTPSTCYNLTIFEPPNLSNPVTVSVDSKHFRITLQGQKEPDLLLQYQPLTGAALSGQYGIWENEVTISDNWYISPNVFSRLLNLSYSFCHNTSGIFFLCGTSTYVCLPANWSGVCTLVFQYPDIELLPSNQTVTVPLLASVPSSLSVSRQKRVPQLLPLLVGLGVSTALGISIAGITSSTVYFQQLSKALSESLDEIASSIITLQSQIDSLAGVVLQNRRALDLLTAEKGGTCVFLQERCCFYVNQSGVVRDAAKRLRERAAELQPSINSWNPFSGLGYWLPSWLGPFVGPLLFILLVIIFGPCLLNCVTHFVSQRMRSFIQDTTKGHVDRVLFLQNAGYKSLSQNPLDEVSSPQEGAVRKKTGPPFPLIHYKMHLEC
uniref:Envelope protein syncytin-A n=1 Tax=Myospalax myospalax TaxID=146128 RepID=A0A097PTU9_9RODE|nr:envelope protein syncytin-A [Myospalax myospalax]